MELNSNNIRKLLIDLEICTESSIKEYYPRVRDNDNISVLKCNKSGVIFLSDATHMNMEYYEQKNSFNYLVKGLERKHSKAVGAEDEERRANQLKYLITNKKWLDVGTGGGGVLDLLSPYASETHAVEPQSDFRNELIDLGYTMYRSIEDAEDQYYDVISLFHVLEHFTTPIESLKSIRNKLSERGKIFIEIPHARDFLISFFELESFKAFTFWSEHIILHTRESVKAFLLEAGFNNIVVNNFQRYPLANHLHWLNKNKPGGHKEWPFLRSELMDLEYSNMLKGLDMTDTLLITATK
ncbi:MAG: class I SAM-dependent methyltransferase [Saprospiraceae bacterium]|nr:class I SAM-dependent methyltransferase [Saprospiraceae bacterium]